MTDTDTETETADGVTIDPTEYMPWTPALTAALAGQHDDGTTPLLVLHYDTGPDAGLVRIARPGGGPLSPREAAGVRGTLAAHAVEPLRAPRPGLRLVEIAEIVADAVAHLVEEGRAETAEAIADLLLDDAIFTRDVPAELVVAMVRHEAARRGVLS